MHSLIFVILEHLSTTGAGALASSLLSLLCSVIRDSTAEASQASTLAGSQLPPTNCGTNTRPGIFGNIRLCLVAVDEMFARMGLQILVDMCTNWIVFASS